jgi:hypothetical protein
MSLWLSGLGRGLQNLVHWFESNWGLIWGDSSVGSAASVLQTEGRGFESLSPYKMLLAYNGSTLGLHPR